MEEKKLYKVAEPTGIVFNEAEYAEGAEVEMTEAEAAEFGTMVVPVVAE